MKKNILIGSIVAALSLIGVASPAAMAANGAKYDVCDYTGVKSATDSAPSFTVEANLSWDEVVEYFGVDNPFAVNDIIFDASKEQDGVRCFITSGVPGPQGLVGPVGPQGPAGEDGAAGPQGPPGEDGAAGTNGVDGKDGANGLAGVDGAPGVAGAAGTDKTTMAPAPALELARTGSGTGILAVVGAGLGLIGLLFLLFGALKRRSTEAA